jgi:D-lactate dehydrogenase
MRIAFFSTHGFDREFFNEANRPHGHDIQYLEARLTPATSTLATGAAAVCAFVNDDLHEQVINALHTSGVRLTR